MFIDPMLLDTRARPYNDEHTLFEPKIDGFRAILSSFRGETRIFSRHQTEVTRRFPELWDVPALADEIVLDGEIAVETQDGFDFEAVMERFHLTKPERIKQAAAHRPVRMYVWDILYKGKSLCLTELIRRKSILESVLQPNPYFRLVPYLEGKGVKLFDEICERKLEGVVCKGISSRYQPGKRPKGVWEKVIRWETAQIAIAGIRKEDNAWLAQVNEGGVLRPAGAIEFIPRDLRKAFHGVSKQLIIGEDKHNIYMDPKIQGRVKFRNWTKNGMFRSPQFMEFIL